MRRNGFRSLMIVLALAALASAAQADGRPDTPEYKAAVLRVAQRRADFWAWRAKGAKLAAGLPKVKRIFSCDDLPPNTRVVQGIGRLQQQLGAAPPPDEELQDPGRCSLRNSLALTPRQILASYPDGLLSVYARQLSALRQEAGNWNNFNAATEELRARLKEYIWARRCTDVRIERGDKVVDKIEGYWSKEDVCDLPYYAMVRDWRNLDGARGKFDTGRTEMDDLPSATDNNPHLLDADRTAEGDLVIADYIDLRDKSPAARFYVLKKDGSSLAPIMIEDIDWDRKKLTDITSAALTFNFITSPGAMLREFTNPRTGAWGMMAYHLEGTRFVLDSAETRVDGKEAAVYYTAESGFNDKDFGPPPPPQILGPPKDSPDHIHAPKAPLPALSDAEKARLLRVLTKDEKEIAEKSAALRALVKKDPQAGADLAYLLENRYISALPNEDPLALYQKAADAGSAMAKGRLAQRYLDGHGVTLDLAKAFQLYKEAAEQGDANAQLNLAFIYERGLAGNDADLTEEAFWHCLGTAGRHPARCDEVLGRLEPDQASAVRQRIDAWYAAHPAQKPK